LQRRLMMSWWSCTGRGLKSWARDRNTARKLLPVSKFLFLLLLGMGQEEAYGRILMSLSRQQLGEVRHGREDTNSGLKARRCWCDPLN
jgi:hypothetical protein